MGGNGKHQFFVRQAQFSFFLKTFSHSSTLHEILFHIVRHTLDKQLKSKELMSGTYKLEIQKNLNLHFFHGTLFKVIQFFMEPYF